MVICSPVSLPWCSLSRCSSVVGNPLGHFLDGIYALKKILKIHSFHVSIMGLTVDVFKSGAMEFMVSFGPR